jgi:hypothetical protein
MGNTSYNADMHRGYTLEAQLTAFLTKIKEANANAGAMLRHYMQCGAPAGETERMR